jgi:hypothetical protein
MAAKIKKPVRKAENAPKRVWMVDVIGGYIEVSNLYIWIKLRRTDKVMQYKVDGKTLYRALQNIDRRQTVGQLDFWSLTVEGEKLVVIEPSEGDEEDDFLFQFEVNLRELSEALFYFIN